MDPARWRRIEEIYQSAAERPQVEREAYLAAACDGDEELRREVDSLLAQQSVDTPLDHPACEVAGGLPSPQTMERASDLAGLRVSHYEIQQKLGEGGMGVVYKARDTRLGRAVALKVLPPGKLMDPDRKRRFMQEARAASALNHPHIVTVHDIDQSGGVDFIAMEYVEGRTLGELIGRKGLKLGEALKYAIQIADALAKTHAVSVVHRDLKPGNVMVTRDGRVKVLDFGLAKLTEPASVSPEDASLAEPPSTELGLIVGTLGYMSPEQAQGKKVDARSDIFSFGTVLYEMLTGRRLFARDTQAQTLAAILDSEPPPLPAEIPRELERVVARCLRKDVDHRYQHMDDVKIALEELKEDSDSGRLSVTAAVAFGPRTKAWILAVGAVATVLLVAGGWYLGRSRPETASKPSMRFTITLPAEAPLAPAGMLAQASDRPALALSPDGARLAYVAQIGNKTQICVRDMTSGKVTPLPGTEGGHTPFFSPDGAFIGFFASGKLKKISSGGGLALELADAPNPWGGDWGADNAIYFNRFEGEGIYKIAADGGPVEVVTTGLHYMPEVLSLGQRLLVSWMGSVYYVEGQTPKFVITGFGARYVPTGHLVYAMSGRLMAVPFDPSHTEVTGPSVGLIEDLRTAPFGVAQFTLTQDGTLIYASGRPQLMTSFVWVDRKGKTWPVGLPEGLYSAFDLSPDGRRLALTIDTPEGATDVWIYDLSRAAMSRLTPRVTDGRPVKNMYPRWTPDSRDVVYQREQQSRFQLMRAPIDGSEEAVELWSGSETGPAWLYPMSFSPDGSIMALFGPGPKTSHDLFLMRTAGLGGSPVKTEPDLFMRHPFAECFGQISPDGRWMLFASDQSGTYEIYVTSYPNHGAIHQVSRNEGLEPMWNPKAPEIVYRVGKQMYAVDVTLSPEFRAAEPRLLYEGPYPDVPGLGFDITSDGQQFLRLENKDFLKPSTTLTVVTNFFDELRRRVPPGSNKK